MIPTFDLNNIRYVLVDIWDVNDDRNIRDMDIQQAKMFDTWVFVNKLQIDEKMVACYVNLDNVWYHQTNAVKVLGSVIANNHTYGYGYVNSQNFYDYIIQYGQKRGLSGQQHTWYCDCETTSQKITQYHHLHVLPSEALNACGLYKIKTNVRTCHKCEREQIRLYGELADLVDLCRRVSDSKQSHATFITYYMSAPRWAQKFLIGLHCVARDQDINIMDILKIEGICAKQVQGIYRNDMNVIFELQVLINRVDSAVQWDKEKINRTNIDVVDIPYSEVFKIACEAFAHAESNGARPRRSAWHSYWAQRYALTPNGAIHSQYQKDDNYIKEVKHRYRTKKTVLSTMNSLKFVDLINRTPEITAKTSTKYEWGKVRALYGCDITTHLLADFGMAQCESTLPSWMPVGERASEANIVKLMDTMKIGVPVCYDYDDFNSQHSVSSMQAVINAWLSVYARHLTPEQVTAVDWTSRSLDKMIVKDDLGTGTHYTAKGTLFSGWRLTSFVNTVLNWVYLEKAGLSQNVIKSIHNGDDVYAVTSTLGDAMQLVSNAANMGIRAQVTKMNIGTIAEFLRMDLRTTNITGKQYLSRACATLVHGRVESSEPNSALDAMEADAERITAMVHRGARLQFISNLSKILDINLGRVFDLDVSDIAKVKQIHRVHGGLNDEKIQLREKVVKVSFGNENLEVTGLIKNMSHGINDYINFIAYQLDIDRDRLDTKMVKASAARQLTQYKTKLVIEPISIFESVKLMSLYHGWKNLPVLKQLNQARSVTSKIGLALLDLDNCYKDVLVRTGEPLKWLSILA